MIGMFKMRTIIVVLIAIGMMVELPAGVAAQSEEGLVAEWHFDEGAGNVVKDSSGNGNDGTVNGAVWIDGIFGKALKFDGVDDNVQTTKTLDNSISGGASITIAAWINLAGYANPSSTTPGRLIVGETGIDIQTRYGLYIDSNGRLKYGWGNSAYVSGEKIIPLDEWHFVSVVHTGNNVKIFIDGNLDNNFDKAAPIGAINLGRQQPVAIGMWLDWWEQQNTVFNGFIDEVRIYKRALSAEEILALYENAALTVTKTASPRSIKQGQTTTITISIKNAGTAEIKDIEVADTLPPDMILAGGEISKKIVSLQPQDSRDFQYILQSKDAGTFNLNPASATYSDSKGNYYKAKSNTAAIEVIPSLITTPVPVQTMAPKTSSPSDIGSSSAVLLHGEKTDVVLGEDILLKLSAVNLITKPPMSVQVMIYPPSGMSVTGSEFVKSGAGIYTTTYTLNSGDGKDIEVHIKSNQVGDFNVKGRIVYYFGEEKDKAEDQTLNLPIKVRKEAGQTVPSSTDDAGTTAKTPGFAGELAFIGILFVAQLINKRR